MLFGCLSFGIERIVIFSLRAVQSHDATTRQSKGMNAYMQCTIGMGFIAICQDVVMLLRTALVNSTLPSAEPEVSYESYPIKEVSESSRSSIVTLQSPEVVSDEGDKARQRFWYRRLANLLFVGFLGSQVPGTVGNSDYGNAVDHSSDATLVFRLRYVGSAIALLFSIALAATAWWAATKVPRFKRNAAHLTLFVCALFSITSIYRLCVMSTTTTSLVSTASGSQNTPAEKAAFYIFHILPEYISVLLLLSSNVRDVFGTGMFGDRRFRDETQREKEIKEIHELYQSDKKAGSAVGIYDEDFRMFAKVRHFWRPRA